MADKTPDEQRNSDLRSKVTAYQGQTLTDGALLDAQHQIRAAQDEVRARREHPNV
jgi:hypothetical protein